MRRTIDLYSPRAAAQGPGAGRSARRPVLLGLLSLAALVADARAGGPDPSADVLILRRCPVDYERSASLGSSQFGVVQDCLVAAGDRVKQGQVLGRIYDEDLRAELKLRQLEAGTDVEIRLNEAKSSQATIKYHTTQSLFRRNAASIEDLNFHKTEAEAATIAVEQAKYHRELAKVRLQQAQAQLRAREFVSPHDGIVIAVLKKLGEPVAPNEPVMKIVDTDRLQVTGQVDVTDSWRLAIGQSVRVIPEISGADLPVERELFNGRIVFIDTHIDPLTQTCKILVHVPNRGGLLRAGLETRMEIEPRAPAEVKAPAPSTARGAPADTLTPTTGLAGTGTGGAR